MQFPDMHSPEYHLMPAALHGSNTAAAPCLCSDSAVTSIAFCDVFLRGAGDHHNVRTAIIELEAHKGPKQQNTMAKLMRIGNYNCTAYPGIVSPLWNFINSTDKWESTTSAAASTLSTCRVGTAAVLTQWVAQ